MKKYFLANKNDLQGSDVFLSRFCELNKYNVGLVKKMIDWGVDFKKIKDSKNRTIFWYACFNNWNIEEIKMFKNYDSELLNIPDEKGETPLDIAIILDHKEIKEFLISQGAKRKLSN